MQWYAVRYKGSGDTCYQTAHVKAETAEEAKKKLEAAYKTANMWHEEKPELKEVFCEEEKDND